MDDREAYIELLENAVTALKPFTDEWHFCGDFAKYLEDGTFVEDLYSRLDTVEAFETDLESATATINRILYLVTRRGIEVSAEAVPAKSAETITA